MTGAHAETWNGSAWTVPAGIVRNPSGRDSGILRGASCTAATDCITVGSYKNSSGDPSAMSQVQSGSTWTLWRIGIPSGATKAELWDVDCRTATSCLAVGQKMVGGDLKPLGMDWNGTTWVDNSALRPPSNATLRSVSCVTAGFCLAVGATGANALAQVWSGFGWTVLPQPPAPAGYQNAILHSVSCVSTTWCMAVGMYTDRNGIPEQLATIWDGTRWTLTATDYYVFGDRASYGVSCTSIRNCWSVGETPWSPYYAISARWDGVAWDAYQVPWSSSADGARLRDIACIAADSCKAAGWSIFGGTPTGLIETLTP